MSVHGEPQDVENPPLFPFPLPLPARTHYALLGVGPEATAEEVRAAAARYVKLLKAHGATDSEIAEANGLGLTAAEQREAYDASHPPLELLRLEPCWTSLFDDRARSLAVMRRDLEEFLLRRGASVYFPTDLNRTDFTDDFVHSPLLDASET